MANTSSAKKAIRVSARKTVKNIRRRRAFRDMRKAVQKAVEAGDKELAESLLPKAYKAFDKAAKVGTIHKNTASRYKSRLTKKVQQIVVSKS